MTGSMKDKRKPPEWPKQKNMTESELATLEHTIAIGFIKESVKAHVAHADERPWMPEPNPILLNVADAQIILAEIDRLRAVVVDVVTDAKLVVAAERERILSMPSLMHGCDALGAPADWEHCELLRRALTGA